MTGLDIAMTGSTGAVGTALRDELAARGHHVHAVGRATQPAWDLARPLPAPVLARMAESDVVVHAAADIRLGAPGDELAAVNVEAVRQLVEGLSALDRPPRLVHVSSAFAEPRAGHDLNNAYEVSKHDAEQIVLGSGLEASILRPSLVVGRRDDGSIGRYSGIYIFLRMLRLGIVPAIPGFEEVKVDIVPVDAVAELGAAAVEQTRQGPLVLATSGAAAPTLAELVGAVFEVIEDYSGEKVEPPRFVKPDVYRRLFRPIVEEELSPAQLVLLDTIEIFLPYFERDHVFRSDAGLDRDDVLKAWKASTRYWLEKSGGSMTARGRSIWAKRS